MNELKYRLRKVGGIGDDAADFIEQQAAEIERLNATVKILQALHDEDTLTHIALQAKLFAMEKQEPVSYTVSGEIRNWAMDFSKYKTQHYTRPVYAAPKVAQPLTPDQIIEMNDDVCEKYITQDGRGMALARAIEKAHGIGGQQP